MSKHFDFEKQIYAKINGSHLLPHSKPDQTEAEERILKLGTPEDAAQKQKLKILQQSTSKWRVDNIQYSLVQKQE